MQNCKDCIKQRVCNKSKNVENYSLKSGCHEFIIRDPMTVATMIRLFTDIQLCLDNRSISYMAPGEITSTHYFEGQLEEDIAELRKKYLGGI